MVYLKSKRELDIMRESNRRVCNILMQLTSMVSPGVTLIELNDMAEELSRQADGLPAFKGYQGFRHALCTSVNEQIVHGIPSERSLIEGDIIGLDFGLLWNGFYGDSAVTVPVGKISERARKLMAVTRDSLYAAIDAARVGNTLKDLARVIEQTVHPHGYSVVREFVGHGIGQKLHEEPKIPNYESGASSLKLQPGMTLAIEPMINEGTHMVRILDDKWTAVTADGLLSAHYEHTIVVTENEPEILTEWPNGRFGIFNPA